MATEKTVVKFIKHYSPYVKGDIAGFSPKVAASLVEKEYAVEHKAKAAPKAPSAGPSVDTKDGKGAKDTK